MSLDPHSLNDCTEGNRPVMTHTDVLVCLYNLCFIVSDCTCFYRFQFYQQAEI